MERIKRWAERRPERTTHPDITPEYVDDLLGEYLDELVDHLEQLENLNLNKDTNEGLI